MPKLKRLDEWAISRFRLELGYSAGLTGRCRSCIQTDMRKKFAIEKAIRVLACLMIAFALAFFPPSSSHAASGTHGDHSSIEKSDAAAQSDCGERADGSKSDSAGQECCASMCLATILVDGFAPPQMDVSLVIPVQRATIFVAAEANGFLRPPKPLI